MILEKLTMRQGNLVRFIINPKSPILKKHIKSFFIDSEYKEGSFYIPNIEEDVKKYLDVNGNRDVSRGIDSVLVEMEGEIDSDTVELIYFLDDYNLIKKYTIGDGTGIAEKFYSLLNPLKDNIPENPKNLPEFDYCRLKKVCYFNKTLLGGKENE